MDSESEASFAGVQQVGPAEITALFREAEFSPRKRAHLLLHHDHADQVQRLVIACCVGTYIRPHNHPEQWELMTLLQGNADVITFNSDGGVLRRHSMQDAPVAQIAKAVSHTIIITAPRTLLLEASIPGTATLSGQFPNDRRHENCLVAGSNSRPDLAQSLYRRREPGRRAADRVADPSRCGTFATGQSANGATRPRTGDPRTRRPRTTYIVPYRVQKPRITREANADHLRCRLRG